MGLLCPELDSEPLSASSVGELSHTAQGQIPPARSQGWPTRWRRTSLFLPLLRRAYARRRLFLAHAAWLAAEMNRAAWPAPELTHMRHLLLPALVFPVVAHPREDDSVRPKNRDGSHGIN